jgi:hypothetical protein
MFVFAAAENNFPSLQAQDFTVIFIRITFIIGAGCVNSNTEYYSKQK